MKIETTVKPSKKYGFSEYPRPWCSDPHPVSYDVSSAGGESPVIGEDETICSAIAYAVNAYREEDPFSRWGWSDEHNTVIDERMKEWRYAYNMAIRIHPLPWKFTQDCTISPLMKEEGYGDLIDARGDLILCVIKKKIASLIVRSMNYKQA